MADPRNESLEAAIGAARDDQARYLVYADWLQQQGDPRGELIAVQCALDRLPDPRRLAELRRVQAALIAEHADAWLGKGWSQLFEVTWRWGFVHAIERSRTARSIEPLNGRLARLVISPSARFLRQLSLSAPELGGSRHVDEQPSLDELAGCGPHRTLQSLIAVTERPLNVSRLSGLFPVLESLAVSGGPLTMERASFRNLRDLTVSSFGAFRNGELVLTAEWPRLLSLAVTAEQPTSRVTLSYLKTILDGRRAPLLRRLRLSGFVDANDVALALAESPIASQFVEIEIGSGLSASGLSALKRLEPRLTRLTRLSVAGCDAKTGTQLTDQFGARVELRP